MRKISEFELKPEKERKAVVTTKKRKSEASVSGATTRIVGQIFAFIGVLTTILTGVLMFTKYAPIFGWYIIGAGLSTLAVGLMMESLGNIVFLLNDIRDLLKL